METNTQVQASVQVNAGPLAKVEGLLRAKPVILQLLKFAAIGVINTALDFLILNLISKQFNISSGTWLGLVNVISFSLAMVQSYFWNRAWAFGDAETNPVKNFFRLATIGGLGAVGVILAIVGARLLATPVYYSLLLAVFVVFELVIWHVFRLSMSKDQGAGQHQFVSFIVVSVIGLIINSGVLALLTVGFHDYANVLGNEDVLKNLAKIAATCVSLIWNFIGYKIIVFKK